MLTNDEARQLFAWSGLTYEDITLLDLIRLQYLINACMESGLYFRGTFVCNGEIEFQKKDPTRYFFGLKCGSDYFEGREAVSFNRDGFIGFAGWASSENVQPILKGFIAWVKEMKQK